LKSILTGEILRESAVVIQIENHVKFS